MSDDYEWSDVECPNCGHHPTHQSQCDVIGCEDGYIDEHADDPINFAPGEESYPCSECKGRGSLHWCPKCGVDLHGTIDDAGISDEQYDELLEEFGKEQA